MKSSTKKLLVALAAIALVAIAIFAIPGMTAQQGAKAVTITIENEVTGEVLVDQEVFNTDAENLGDLLAENADELQVEMEDSEYGRFLNSLMGLAPESMDAGPWWMYGYVSPEQDLDLAVGAAPGVDDVMLHDGDSVNFVFTSNPGF